MSNFRFLHLCKCQVVFSNGTSCVTSLSNCLNPLWGKHVGNSCSRDGMKTTLKLQLPDEISSPQGEASSVLPYILKGGDKGAVAPNHLPHSPHEQGTWARSTHTTGTSSGADLLPVSDRAPPRFLWTALGGVVTTVERVVLQLFSGSPTGVFQLGTPHWGHQLCPFVTTEAGINERRGFVAHQASARWLSICKRPHSLRNLGHA